jgi:RimJ/RimL family protein N-acetyltransferase
MINKYCDFMDLRDFADVHLPALELDEVRYNVQIAVLAAAIANTPVGFSYWNLGAPGHCAIRSPGRAMLLGNLEKSECHKLAQDTSHDNNIGVVGSDETAQWFVERAKLAGMKFELPIPMRIHVLAKPPVDPAIPGLARATVAQDSPLLFEWLLTFHNEAIPHDPLVTKERVDELAESGRYLFWTIDDQPVSVAAISRRLKHSAAIGPVYTPPELRGRGYAAAVTAAVANCIFAEGKSTVSIYTDLRNPMSNRCYSKVGFKPYCDSWHYVCA